MAVKIGFLPLAVVLLIGLGQDTVDASLGVDECGSSTRSLSRMDFEPNDHRVVGGIQTEPHAWPWTVELSFRGKHHCGGALIKPDIVLTAAHCFARTRRANAYKIYTGGHGVLSGTVHTVNEIQIHPFYHVGYTTSFDAALLRISPPANLSDPNIRLACLPWSPPVTGDMCVVTGWGRLSENGMKPSYLREIHIPIIPTIICNDYHHYNGRVNAFSMFCAGYSSGRIDSCQGDSGGPLVCQTLGADGKYVWQLQGIVSWGIGCAQPGYPGVYSKVFNIRTWINTFLIQHGY
uniref:Peptidase S1 domain-containing protein n=1 Tax=Panagrellus redivivus TaxID=6233 RepID=A0A7E4VIJ8_PANRE